MNNIGMGTIISVVYLFANLKNFFVSPFVLWPEFNFEKAGKRMIASGKVIIEMNVIKLVAAFRFPMSVTVANAASIRF